jgi:hypothetical protein
MSGVVRLTLPPRVAAIALAIIALNLFDAGFTLMHLSQGADELNPFMQHLLAHGTLAFAIGKHFLVGSAVVALAASSTVSLALDALRFVALPAYALVAAYHLTLASVFG